MSTCKLKSNEDLRVEDVDLKVFRRMHAQILVAEARPTTIG